MGNRGFEPSRTRTIALVGHRSSGKTSLGDILLKTTGVTRCVNRVEDGTSLLDHEPEERQRKATLGPAWAWMEWKDHMVHLVDTPGASELAHERSMAMACSDGVLVVVSASDGIEIGTETALEEADRRGLAKLAVISKLDHDHDLDSVLSDLDAATSAKVVPLQLPFFDDEGAVAGVVSLLEQKVLRYDPDGSGQLSREPLPRRLVGRAQAGWERLVESVAVTDDELLEAYLEYLELPDERVMEGLVRGVARGELLPVVYTSARRVIGADQLLDAVVQLLPSPVDRKLPVRKELDGTPLPVDPQGPFIAQLVAKRLDEDNMPYSVFRVWAGKPSRHGRWVNANTGATFKVRKLYQIRGPRRKQAFYVGPGAIFAAWDHIPGRPGDTFTEGVRTTLPVPELPPAMMSYLVDAPVEPKLLRESLERLVSLDRALRLHTDESTGGVLLAGISERHVQRAMTVLNKRLGIRATPRLPPVAYRETPVSSAHGVEGIYQRVNDGEVQEFGACRLDLVPTTPDSGNRFFDEANDDAVPRRFRPAIDEGVQRGMRRGPRAGYPVLGANVRLTGGDYNILFSEDEHFRSAAEIALRNALEQAGTRILEPWCKVTIWTRGDVGHVIQDVANNRGRVTGIEMDGPQVKITAECPFRELRTFAPRLQALTGGRGRFVSHPSHYALLPYHLENEAIASSPFLAAPGPGRSAKTVPQALVG